MRMVFLDVETTGLGLSDRLCEVAYKEQGGQMVRSLFKPPVPVSLAAMSVNHITNSMLESCERFVGSKMHADLKILLEDRESVLVAHNADFDAGMLRKEGIHPARVVCTMRVARELTMNPRPEKHTLSYLRYFFELDVPQSVKAHDAESDVIVLEKLFEHLQSRHGLVVGV